MHGAGATCCRISARTSAAIVATRSQRHRIPWRDRRMAREPPAAALGDSRRLRGRGRAGRHRAHRGFQLRRQCRRQLLRRQPAQRVAPQRRQGLPQAGAFTCQSHRVAAHAGRAAQVRASTRARLRCSGVDAAARAASASTVRAAREVILGRGAIATPQLLQLSGIGPADLLREHGIARAARARRRRREPAGSPADSPGVQGARRAHAQRGRLEPVGSAGDRARIRAAPHRAR